MVDALGISFHSRENSLKGKLWWRFSTSQPSFLFLSIKARKGHIILNASQSYTGTWWQACQHWPPSKRQPQDLCILVTPRASTKTLEISVWYQGGVWLSHRNQSPSSTSALIILFGPLEILVNQRTLIGWYPFKWKHQDTKIELV